MPPFLHQGVSGDSEFLLESDHPCLRHKLAHALEKRGSRVVPSLAAPSHSILQNASQLASWFEFSRADVFVLKPVCEVHLGQGMLRLSGWSGTAMLRALQQRFHRLCESANNTACTAPIGCSTLMSNHLLSRGHIASERRGEAQHGQQMRRWTLGIVENPDTFWPNVPSVGRSFQST